MRRRRNERHDPLYSHVDLQSCMWRCYKYYNSFHSNAKVVPLFVKTNHRLGRVLCSSIEFYPLRAKPPHGIHLLLLHQITRQTLPQQEVCLASSKSLSFCSFFFKCSGLAATTLKKDYPPTPPSSSPLSEFSSCFRLGAELSLRMVKCQLKPEWARFQSVHKARNRGYLTENTWYGMKT